MKHQSCDYETFELVRECCECEALLCWERDLSKVVSLERAKKRATKFRFSCQHVIRNEEKELKKKKCVTKSSLARSSSPLKHHSVQW